MKILQVCLRSPYPPKDGGTIAMESLGESLFANGAQVQMVCFNTRKHFVDPQTIPLDFKKRFNPVLVDLDARVTVRGVLMSLFSKESYNVSRFDIPEMHVQIEDMLKDTEFDCILIESLFMLPYVQTIRKKSKALVLYRAHNIEHRIWKRMASQSLSPIKRWYFAFLAKRLEQYERKAIHWVDAILPLTATDASWFESIGHELTIKVIPIGIHIQQYEAIQLNHSDLSVFHVGSMDWLPNVEGITWFVDQVWPMVRETCPDAKLYLAGKGMPDFLFKKAENGIMVSGYVNDLKDFMNGKQIMVVPLFSGSGMRVKILEGMAAARTIVSTKIGAEGIECIPGKDILLADDAMSFASHIVHCIQNPKHAVEIGLNGKSLAQSKYDAIKIGKELFDFVSDCKKMHQ